ncbi:MAG: hypothetical protein ACOCW1_04160 [Chitinispirillaceae bacterium]
MTARDFLSGALADTISRLFNLSAATAYEHIFLQRTSRSVFGDLCTPAPLRLSSTVVNSPPSEIADRISSSIQLDERFVNSEVYRRKGFLNFCMSRSYMLSVLSRLSEFSPEPLRKYQGENQITQSCAAILKHAAMRGIVPDTGLLRGYSPHQDENTLLRLVVLCHDDLLSDDPKTFKRNSLTRTVEAYSRFYKKYPILTEDALTTVFRLALTSAVWLLCSSFKEHRS